LFLLLNCFSKVSLLIVFQEHEDIPEIKEGKESRKTTIIFDQQPGQQEPKVLEVNFNDFD